MSADLFEAFGQNKPAGQAHDRPSASKSDDITSPSQQTDKDTFLLFPDASDRLNRPQSTEDEVLWQKSSDGNDVLFDAAAEKLDVEEFGDFEDVQNLGEAHKKPPYDIETITVAINPSHAGTTSLIDFEPERQTFTKSGLQESNLENDNWGDFEAVSPVQPYTKAPSPNETDEDIWETFESTERSTIQSQTQAPTVTNTGIQQLRAPSSQEKPLSQPEPPEDDWDDFEDGQPSASPSISTPITNTTSQRPPPPQSQTSAKPISRPTNVPPPALLLSLFPNLISNLLSQPLDHSDNSSSVTTLHHSLLRILSGRPHRWRRDTHLAQSTRISAAGKPGGMKLTSLSKDEKMKEEREAAEAVEVWKKNIHALSKIVSDGRTGVKTGGLKVNTNASVKELKGTGVLEDRLCCAVCGLKRSERVVGLDEGDDVFGEFWIDNWGHRECEEWWKSAETALKQQ